MATPFDNEANLREYAAQNVGSPAQVPTNRPWLTGRDAALFAPRGVLDAAQDAYGLLDTIAFDSLPDWDKNPLGTSDSIVGGLAQGVVNFAAGWVPIAGWLGKGGQAAKAFRLVKAAETELPLFNLLGKSASSNLTGLGSIAAGAAVDFTVFDGHDGRLTDLLATVPGLKDPVEEYLGVLLTKPDDSALWGRVKNVLEGAGVGGLTHAFHLGIKRTAAFNKARAAGKTTEEATAAAEKAVKDSEIIAALEDGKRAGDTRGIAAHSDVAEDIAALREDPNFNGGGQTFNTDGTRWQPSPDEKLDVVSLASTEVDAADLSPQAIRDFAGKFGKVLEDPAVKLGVFKLPGDPPRFSIDLNVVADQANRERNLKIAAEHGQLAIWDSSKMEVVPTGLTETDVTKSVKPGQQAEDFVKRLREAAPEPEVKPAADAPSAEGQPPKVEDGAAKTPETAAQQPAATATPVAAPVTAPVTAPKPDKYHRLLAPLGYDRAAIYKIRVLLDKREVTKAQLGMPTERINPRELEPWERTMLALQENSPNFEHLDSAEGILALSRVADELTRETAASFNQSFVTRTLEEQGQQAVKELSDFASKSGSVDETMKNLIAAAETNRKDLESVMNTARSHRYALVTFAEHVDRRISHIIEAPHKYSDDDVAGAIKQLEAFSQFQSSINGQAAEIGRGLGFFRHDVQGLSARELLPNFESRVGRDQTTVEEIIRTAGGKDKAVDLLRKAKAALAPRAGETRLVSVGRAAKLAEMTLGRKTLNATIEYWINALLWNPASWAVNGVSNAAMSILLPVEKMVGAGIVNGPARAVVSTEFRQATREMTSLFSGVSDSLRFGQITASTGESVLDSAIRTVDTTASSERRAISAANFGVNPNSLQGAAINWLGKGIRIPTGIMGGTDEMFRQQNYRATVLGHLAVEATDKGLIGKTHAQYVNRRLEIMVANGQAYTIESVRKRGLEMAKRRGITSPGEAREFAEAYANAHFREDFSALAQYAKMRANDAAFSGKLPTGSIGASVQLFAQQHPVMRFFMPFVRTPMNILYAAGRRFDAFGVGRYVTSKVFPSTAGSLEKSRSRFVQDMISGDKARQAEAVGRIATGIAFAGIGMTAANAGLLTGRGPKDPDERKLLIDAGWLPYAIKTPEGYIAYSRLDPFATIFGTMADMVDAARYAPADEADNLTTAFNGLLVGLANNVTNKSYLTGIANVIEALQAPDQKAAAWARKSVASFVPSGLKNVTTALGDETTKDVRSLVDALMERIPGLSTSVRPSRNVVGEPIKKITAAGSKAISQSLNTFVPFSYSEVSSDPIKRELASLGYGFTPMRGEKYGMDLREVRNNGKGQDAYDRWGELVGDIKLGGRTIAQDLEGLIKSKRYRTLPPESTSDIDSPRIGEVKRVIQKYRDAAWKRVVREYPVLADREREFLRSQRALKSGRDLRNLPNTLNRGN